MRAAIVLLAAVCLTHTANAQTGVDWSQVARETTEHFTALLRIDTSNPPGNESKVAAYLKAVLEREGIPVKLFALEPDRANLVARIKGNGSKRPLLIMAHTDVVGVQRQNWKFDPFAAQRDGPFIYGRGAVDDKDSVAAGLIVMLLLKRNNVKLDRDVIFLAEAGEESTTRVGIDFMVKEHWAEIDAEFALAEGGGGVSRGAETRYLTVSTTEKVPRTTTLVAKGVAGHGSIPRQDNAIVRLSQAIGKIAAWQTPVRLNETTRTYFERLATRSSPEAAARYNGILTEGGRSAADLYFRENEPAHASTLRTSISPTVVKAGFRSNVIPSEAEATLDIRALPDEDMPKLYAELTRVIDDPNVTIVPPADPARPVSRPAPLNSDMFKALEAAQRAVYPGAITLPSMLNGATDMAQIRAKGIHAYGIGGVTDERYLNANGAHSDNERIEEAKLHKFVEFLWTAVLGVAAPAK